MGLFFDLMQQSQINTARRQTSSLEERVSALEAELNQTRALLHEVIQRLEKAIGQDLDHDGRVG